MCAILLLDSAFWPSFSCWTNSLIFKLMVTSMIIRCQGLVAVKQAQNVTPLLLCLTVGMRCYIDMLCLNLSKHGALHHGQTSSLLVCSKDIIPEVLSFLQIHIKQSCSTMFV